MGSFWPRNSELYQIHCVGQGQLLDPSQYGGGQNDPIPLPDLRYKERPVGRSECQTRELQRREGGDKAGWTRNL